MSNPHTGRLYLWVFGAMPSSFLSLCGACPWLGDWLEEPGDLSVPLPCRSPSESSSESRSRSRSPSPGREEKITFITSFGGSDEEAAAAAAAAAASGAPGKLPAPPQPGGPAPGRNASARSVTLTPPALHPCHHGGWAGAGWGPWARPVLTGPRALPAAAAPPPPLPPPLPRGPPAPAPAPDPPPAPVGVEVTTALAAMHAHAPAPGPALGPDPGAILGPAVAAADTQLEAPEMDIAIPARRPGAAATDPGAEAGARGLVCVQDAGPGAARGPRSASRKCLVRRGGVPALRDF